MRIHFYNSIRFRLLFSLLLATIFVVGVSLFTSKKLFEKEFTAIAHNQMKTSFKDIEAHIEIVGQIGLMWAKHFSLEEELVRIIKSGDSGKLETYAIQKLEESSADTLILTDNKGRVIVRGHNRNQGDSLLHWNIVQNTLKNKSPEVAIVSDLESFIIYASALVYSKESNLPLGVLLIGHSLNDAFLNNIKENESIEITIVRSRAIMASTFRNSEREFK